MHLVQGMSSVKTTKPKASKLTNAKRKELGDQLHQLNKELKQQGRHDERMTFDEYLDYLHGKPKAKPRKPVQRKTTPAFRRETPDIPSLGDGCGVAVKQDPKKYTGTLVKGIATMHKSNAVPVIDDEQATDIARMRRG